ncbi:DNA repair protein RAD50 [Candida viswanathii]|uniref:DNA repair protein RAD50 n=1 Tax=Candida viswanathii TaxID=5486 RepID=A0A367XW49_9ASCO|nr:DNA repair protein RAD50 [Candida viswanathii]
MSSIYKLSIKGIRAFEQETDETIQFGFPLTLICGQNGCGKTTIIECLKYATTGTLPPNSKGGAFVHDPTLDSRSVTNGQIKLAFKNINGKSMITTRSVQANLKSTKSASGATVTFKTLEGQLALIEAGNRISISSKNAELDAQIPVYLGASPAILENVIFCHQDDSLWPLSEPSALKKKFDDIFEASKFTKVLDNLKSIKKDMTTDIKLIEQSVNHLKIDKDRARKVQDKLAELTGAADTYTEEIADLNIQIERKEKEAEDLFATNQEFQKTISDYENLMTKKLTLEEQIERTKRSIEILPDSDEELMNKQENFAAVTEEKSRKVEELQAESARANNELKNQTKVYNDLIRIDGSLRAKKVEYDQNLKTITEMINEYATALDVEVIDETQKNIAKFKNQLEKTHKSIVAEQKKLLADNKRIETEKQSELQEVVNAISREEQHFEYASNDIETNNQKLLVLRRKVDAGSNDETELTEKRIDLADTNRQLQEKKDLNEVKDLDSKIMEANSEISRLEFSLDELARQVSTSNKQSELRSKVTFLEDSAKAKNAEIAKIITLVGDNYQNVVGSKLDVDVGDSLLNQNISHFEIKYEDQQKKVLSLEADLEITKKTLESAVKASEDNDAKLKTLKRAITSVIEEDEIDEYESVVQELEDNYRDVLEDVNTAEVTKDFKGSAIQMAEKSKCCLLCKRLFEEGGLEVFIKDLKQSVDENKIQEIKSKAAEIKNELDSVKSINMKVVNYRECVANVAEFESKIKDLRTKSYYIDKELTEATKEMKATKESLDAAVQLKKPLSDATRINLEVQDIDIQIDELNEDLTDFGSVVASVSELQKQQQHTNIKLKKTRQNLNDWTENKYKVQREVQRLENRVKDIKLQISNLERSLADVTNIKNNISETEKVVAKAEERLEEIKDSLEKLRSDKDIKEAALKKVQSDNHASEERIQKRVLDILGLASSFTSLDDAISYFENNVAAQLEENTHEMQDIFHKCESLTSQIEEYSTTIKSLEKEVMDASRVEHNILANIDYRGQISRLDETELELNSLDIENAQTRKDEYQEKSRRLRDAISTLTADHAGKIGEVKQIKDQISGLKKELETEYKNVNQSYHEEWIKLQTNLLVSNDIHNYSKALDNAIMKYHSIKMEEINRILTELWSQTYKGSDIATIAIKSDVNLQAKGNRSYNYRVVMIKDTSELDMRGRCSAGQKVLASILIRLALAECFGANCGMIALDEPTTNLDAENSEALAAALTKIIEYRKAQSNFQLIVITHDQKFLTHMQADRFTDHFYRIQRDETSKSRIYSLPISRIQDD